MVTINIGRNAMIFFGAIILVFAVIGFSVAYGGNQPAVMGHTAGEIDGMVAGGGGTSLAYDSGWFTLSAKEIKTINHNLGTRFADFEVFVADDNGGSPDLNTVRLATNSMVNTNGLRALFDYRIENMQDNSFDIRGGWAFITDCASSGGCAETYGAVHVRIISGGSGGGSDNTILDTCQICIRWADSNGRASTPWRCANTESELLTDFTGTVNSDDDLDLRISCTDADVQSDYQLCLRWADANSRGIASWRCVDFGQDLITDFTGTVNSDDDFDLLIKPKVPGEISTSCGLCLKQADSNTRASRPWRCTTLQTPLLTDFTGSVNSDDDFDLKLSCNLLFDEGH